jgi:hypothetical protein
MGPLFGQVVCAGNRPGPQKPFRDLVTAALTSFAFGFPSLVIVISCPPATNSRSADKCALAERTLMDGPTPGKAATSLKTAGSLALDDLAEMLFFSFTASM